MAIQEITVGGGCFWCVEAVFQRVRGVLQVESGYAGGHVEHPTYEQVCTKSTGHAEVCRIKFDTDIVSLSTLYDVFFKTHDPTTPDRQGNDVGPQYRSVIFYHDDEQKKTAEKVRGDLVNSQYYDDPIVTEIAPLTTYYPAEKYHQNYFNDNTMQPYCMFNIAPKVKKFQTVFPELH